MEENEVIAPEVEVAEEVEETTPEATETEAE